jgi:hypothetical protein
MRSEWALIQSHIPLRELWPFKAAKIMAVMRLVRGYRRPYLLLGSGIWANISSRLCPEGTGSIAPPPPSLHREAARPPSSQAAPSLDFSHPVRFTPSSGRAAPRQSAPSLYLLPIFSPIIPNSQKTGKPWSGAPPGCRLKSASSGAPRRASASADAKGAFPGRRRPTTGQRPLEAEFIRRADRPTGRRPWRRLKSASPGAPRQASASADAKGSSPGRRRPTVGQRPLEAEFIRRAGRPTGRRPWRRLKSASPGAPRQASASADAKESSPDRRRPTTGQRPLTPIEIGLSRRWRAKRRPPPTQKDLLPVGAGRPRPLEAEFIRRAGRPSAEGLGAD